MGVSADDDWEEIDNARAIALEAVFGRGDGRVFHAAHPFSLGGFADVRGFYEHIPGTVYVTSELSGKPESCYGDYELMICHREPSDWGPNVISRLAPYTQTAYIGAGESMDIRDATPEGSSIVAFLFDTYETFLLYGHPFELRLCIGITQAELEFKLETEGAALIELLKQHKIYPYTDLNRVSIPLPRIG